MNGFSPSKTGVTDWPPGPPQLAARGAPEPSEPFAGILDAQQARTATAEGQDSSSRSSQRSRRDDDGPVASDRAEARSNADWARDRRAADGTQRERPAHDDGSKAADSSSSAAAGAKPADATQQAGDKQPEAAAAAAAAATATPAPVPAATPAADGGQPGAAPAQAPVDPAALIAGLQQAAPAQQKAALAQAANGGAPAAASAAPSGAQAATPQAGAASGAGTAIETAVDGAAGAGSAQAAPVVAAAAAQGQPATAKLPAPVLDHAQPALAQAAPGQSQAHDPTSAKHDGGGSAAGGQQQPGQPGALPPQASDQARTVARAYGGVHRQPQAPAPAASTNGTPTVVGTPAAAGDPASARADGGQATPVPLARAAENVEHVLQLAATRGVTHARIALNPEQLGSIDVHLRHTADGIVAKVVAHAPEAVQQLQQAVADLRRALEGQGLNLLNLDIGHSGDQAGRAGANAGDGGSRSNGGDPSTADGGAAATETTTTSTLQLPNGVLVDVLA